MKGQLIFFGKLLAFWLIFFLFQRLLFIFHFFSDFEGHYGELFTLPFYSLKLDLSAFGYISSISFLLSIPSFFLKDQKLKLLNKLFQIYFWVLLVLVMLMMSGEIVTYIEWKTKLSSKIFIHFNTPAEIFRTASGVYTYWYFFYFFIQLIFAYIIHVRLFKKNKLTNALKEGAKNVKNGIAYVLVVAFVIVLMIRGGLQQIPVSATDAYFSNKQIVNDVSVNASWNFIHTCFVHFKVDLAEYYDHLDPAQAEEIKNDLYATDNVKLPKIFNQKRPNIILITLEGWSGQMIEPMGGEPGITPNFNTLCEEGLLFSQIYATSGTSETGLSSIISGYPTLSGISISSESAKCRKLPSINKSLEQHGYNSFYTFGGSLSYGNLGGYLTDVGFDRLVDENDLDLEPKGTLGIHDEAMFKYFSEELRQAKRPYFYGLFTQSTHAPYDMQADPIPGYDDPYVTSLHYADEHLGKFIEEVRALPDFENTVVLFISDHGRANQYNQNTYDEKFFHIPLLIWGGALDYSARNANIDKVGSQADLAKTLLNQLDINSDDFIWSKDLLNPTTKSWALCTSTLSYGWKNKDGYTVYHMIDERFVSSPYKDQPKIDDALKKCRAVLESMYTEFIGL